jgi:hypothetical protein
MQSTAIIVDAYSSSNLLAPELKKRGYRCVHLQSQKSPPAFYLQSYRPEDFAETIIHDGDFEATVRALKKLHPVCLIAGAEISVELADLLNQRLGLVGNEPQTSLLKRNKFLMIEALREAGLHVAKQLKSNDLSTIKNWIKKELYYPVVIKPLNSAGTDGVQFCKSESEVEAAFGNLYQRANQLGFVNHEVLVLEFLRGDEYVVDTVSAQGKHRLAAFWSYRKVEMERDHFIYESCELMSSSGEVQNSLFAYTLKALDVLGVQWGPAHCELILTPQGPAWVEMGGRLHGADAPLLQGACCEVSQVELTCDAYLNPSEFIRHHHEKYQSQRFGLAVFLINKKSGIIRDVKNLQRISELPSFFKSRVNLKPGDRVSKTVDLYTTPGSIFLVDRDKQVVLNDYRTIRRIEEDGMFEIVD